MINGFMAAEPLATALGLLLIINETTFIGTTLRGKKLFKSRLHYVRVHNKRLIKSISKLEIFEDISVEVNDKLLVTKHIAA